MNKAAVTLIRPPGLMAATPALTIIAPTNPPMSAWEELEGIPNHHVRRFQIMADNKAAMRTTTVMLSGSVRPVPIVSATATPKRKGPIKLINAANHKTLRGFMARDAMGMATIVELSWKPFRKPKNKVVISKIVKAILMQYVNKLLTYSQRKW